MLSDAALMLRFLFVADADFAVDAAAAAKVLGPDAAPVLEAALTSLDKLGDWSAAEIETALKAALVDGLGLKPQGVRAGAGGRHGPDGLAAAVRVDGAAGPRAVRWSA